ncbi:MAG: leucine--tRNA ligase [Alcaligenaceae bacterium]|nr:leucine--tRNA ligase [Alcaligenaceae bacterium]
MQEQYHPRLLEEKAQAHWQKTQAYKTVEYAKNEQGEQKPKFYGCSMLPYPSGKLHMGHVRNYTINDVMARQLRMKGYNVLMPMGWDAFGMPAENAAIKSQVPPAQWTYDNIEYMKKQMQSMGLSIDWDREIATCDADYYRWTQWLFLKMLEKGIIYRKTQTVNWDPVDQTVLANEQVIDGRGWRSGAPVEKREIPGYYLRITDYANELLQDVQSNLPGWPERVRLMQENWIGQSQGVRFAFPHDIKDSDGRLIQDGQLFVFTTRVDTLMGVSYCAVAPEHPIATLAAKNNPDIAEFIEKAKQGGTTEAELATKEKEGIPTGLYVEHPITGEKVAVWVANYVLMTYGDGAVMAVPAHDARDFEFAKKYNLPIQQVIAVEGKEFSADKWHDHYAQKEHTQLINSGQFNGLTVADAVDAIATVLSEKGLGEKQTTYRLRDWGISRQRYWGTPIPIIHCDVCGPVPVPEKDLPVKLPENLIPDGSGNPLNKDTAFTHCLCPTCGKEARRETDTMDTFVDSSWYFLRYTCADNAEQMVDERTHYWMPMDQYIGGIEHAILHLLYARFWFKVMRDLDLVKYDEPFKKLLCQGMVLNHIYSRRTNKGAIEYFWPHEVENITDDKGTIVGAKLIKDGSPIEYGGIGTMSKSKNNGVDPQSLIETMGADTARLFTMFTSPPEQTLEWSVSGVEGSYRFLRRLWGSAYQLKDMVQAKTPSDWTNATKEVKDLRLLTHQVLKQVNYDYERMQYNTVVSAGMKILNAIEGFKFDSSNTHHSALAYEMMSILIRILYPVVPHITWHLWNELEFTNTLGDLLDAPWPDVDDTALIQDEIELMLQVNGKLRGSIQFANGSSKEVIENLAKEHPAVAKFLDGRPVKRVIVVPNRLVNVVG